MTAFNDQHLDHDEFEGLFDDDSEDIGFEKLIAQVAYNDRLTFPPISSRCISPICDTIQSYCCENTLFLPLAYETPFVDIGQQEAPGIMQSLDVACPIHMPPFLDTPSSVSDTSALLFPAAQQDTGIDNSTTTPSPETATKKPTRAKVCHKVTPALSAYNFFFRDERDRILNGASTYNWTSERQELLLRRHWQQDRSQKRRHVKSHGKINFATLSKSISVSWKRLPESCKEFYREISLRDWDRFRKESSALEAAAGVSLPSKTLY